MIAGEKRLGKYQINSGTIRQREEEMSNWLNELGFYVLLPYEKHNPQMAYSAFQKVPNNKH
ncbi:MAG: hypothetical protein ACRC3H_04845 [Lachnospiraceae bacterium]